MGRAARVAARGQWDVEIIANEVDTIYDEFLRERRVG